MANIRTEPLTDFYEVKEELGRGRFAVVKRCIKISSGEVFAAKCIRKARAGRRGREQLLLEIDILYQSDHPKLVNLYDVFETRTEMILILEYAAGGDLHKHCLEQVETVRTEKEICFLIYQIVEAAVYLHENHVVHLDLKPENILLKNDERFPDIRLIDFGLSRRVDLPYSQYDIVGTPEYVAPEVLAYEPIGLSADLWSIGVVAYVLLSGISPFAGDDIMETYGNISNVDFDFDAEEFDDISDEAKDFIECLLIKDPKERLTIKECLDHPWLQQMAYGVMQEDIEAAIKAETVFSMLAQQESVREEEVSDEEEEIFSSENEATEQAEKAVDSNVVTENAEETKQQENAEHDVEADQNDQNQIVEKEDITIQGEEVINNNVVIENGMKTEIEPKQENNMEDEKKDQAKPCNLNLFDIDSLICKDVENEVKDEVKDVCKNDAHAQQVSMKDNENLEIDQEIVKSPEDETSELQADIQSKIEQEISVENQVQIDASQERLVEIQAKNDADERTLAANVEEKDVTANEESTDVQNGRHEDNVTQKISLDKSISVEDMPKNSNSVKDSLNVNDSQGKKDQRTGLVKMKSVDDGLLFSRRKSNEISKGKLGAHLEKLTKAGLNFSSENDVRRPGPIVVKQGSSKRQDSGDKINIDVRKGGLPRQDSTHSSRSSGSRTPPSGCVTPESGRGTPTGSAPAFPPALVSTKDAKVPSRNSNGKQTTTDDKCMPFKKPPAMNLGVRQGIAAQMASKFANPEKKDAKVPAGPSAKVNSVPSPQNRISNRKVFETVAAGTTDPNAPSTSPQMSPKMDNARKFISSTVAAKMEAFPKGNVNGDAKTRSPKISPKFDQSAKLNDAHNAIKDDKENVKTTTPDMEDQPKIPKSSQSFKIQSSANKIPESQVDGAIKKTNSKENIIQKFERQIKADTERDIKSNSVNVQPKGLQFNFSLQSHNKFKAQEAKLPVEKEIPIQKDSKPNRREIKVPIGKGARPITFSVGSNMANKGVFEMTTVEASNILDQDSDLGHVEHTAIGAIATMPRTPLRELRSKSRTSRDRGDGSPSSPRKSYRRLYVTHVKGSKSEQEFDAPEDIAEFKTKVERDELKVELLVKFPDLKFGTI